MNIQAEKLELIEMILKTDNESALRTVHSVFNSPKVILEAEAFEKKKRIARYEKSLKLMRVAELIKRVKKSEKDIKEGKVVSTKKLKKEFAKW